jgi:anti-sigma factor (TIGR02949 family)
MSILDRLVSLFRGAPRNGEGGVPAAAADAPEMISCEDALRLVHDYLDGELERSSETSVKEHFDACERCYPHLNLETSFREAVRRASSGEGAQPALRARVLELLAEAEAEG